MKKMSLPTSLCYGQFPILVPAWVSDMVMFFPPMFIWMLPRYVVAVVWNTATALPLFGPGHAMRYETAPLLAW